MTTRILILGFLLLSVSYSSAQTDTSGLPEVTPIPVAPFVAAVPEAVQWKITLAYPTDFPLKDTNSKPKHFLKQIDSVKSNGLKRDVLTYLDGSINESWYRGNTIITTSQDGKKVYLNDFGAANQIYGEAGNPAESPGFPGVSWVKLRYFDKIVVFNKQSCFHYLLKRGDAGDVEAWIDVKTGFPIGYRYGGVTYTYTYDGNPVPTLALPPQIQQTFGDAQERIDRLKRLQASLQR